jgi:hypothetical protein
MRLTSYDDDVTPFRHHVCIDNELMHRNGTSSLDSMPAPLAKSKRRSDRKSGPAGVPGRDITGSRD